MLSLQKFNSGIDPPTWIWLTYREEFKQRYNVSVFLNYQLLSLRWCIFISSFVLLLMLCCDVNQPLAQNTFAHQVRFFILLLYVFSGSTMTTNELLFAWKSLLGNWWCQFGNYGGIVSAFSAAVAGLFLLCGTTSTTSA